MYLLNGTVIINLIKLFKNEKKACKNPNCSHNPSALRKRKSLLSKWQTQQFEDQYTHYTKKVNIEPCMHLLMKTEIFYIPLFMNITSYNLRYHVHLRNLYQKHVIGL